MFRPKREIPPGTIKNCADEFVVQEVHEKKPLVPCFQTAIWKTDDLYTQFLLTKRGMSARGAYNEVLRQLNIEPDNLTYCGLKDAVAVTAQLIVVEGKFKPSFRHDKIWLQQIGHTIFPLRHSQHEGNRFSVVVRTQAQSHPTGQEFVNLFGPQRFGDGHIEAGRFLLEGDFDAALAAYEGSTEWKILESYLNEGASSREALLHPDFRFHCEFKVNQWISKLWNALALETKAPYLPTWSAKTRDLYAQWWDPSKIDKHVSRMGHQFARPVKAYAKDHEVKKHEYGFLHSFTLRPGAYATTFLPSIYDVTDVSRKH